MGTDAPRSRRHRRIRSALAVLAVVLSLALVAVGLGVWTVARSFPALSGQATLTGLGDDVTVYRDRAGIPQILARSAGDLFKAEGYVHAQDRFWEMDFRRHVTSGRLSELFGRSQVGTDTFIRTLGWRAVAEQEVALLDLVTLGYYQAYADGVNAYLAGHSGADLSLEYAVLALQNPGYTPEPWTPADSVAWLKAMAWDLRSNLDDEIDRAMLAGSLNPAEVARLHPDYPYAAHPTIVGGMPATAGAVAASVTQPVTQAVAPTTLAAGAEAAMASSLNGLHDTLAAVPELLGPAGGEIGSNSWVVSGSHTATGRPILANDPHLGAVMPSVWYQVGLRCRTVTADCPFDLAGYGFSGLPGIIIGHNARIAWGFTNLGPDVADLYLEKVTGDSYEYDGAAKPIQVRREKIRVAGGPPVQIEIRSTEHGPIVSGLEGSAFPAIAADYPGAVDLPPATVETGYQLSLQWTALTPGHTATAIFALGAATDWAGFRQAASLFDVPSQNLVYADVDGNIGYQAPGLIPIRRAGDGTVPVPGWTSQYGWDGYIPFDALPQSLNPPNGFIVTANNAPVGPDYPYLITRDWDLGYRATEITARLQALIDAGTPMTPAMMSEIQADTFSPLAARLVPMLQAIKPTEQTRAALALFDGWDYLLESDSAAAAYFNIVWRNLLVDLFDTKLPKSTWLTGGDRAYAVVIALLDEPDSPWWKSARVGSAGRDSMLQRVLKQAAAESERLMGPDASTWRWGSIHTLEVTNASFGKSGVAPLEWLFNRGPYELAGGSSVIDAVGWDATAGYTVDWVPSMREVVSLADWDESTWLNLTGSSGHAFHPNYADQTPLWQHHKTRPWPFSLAAVRAAATDTLLLRAGR
ncbi:penicillin acylase family protein [Cryobacterium algoritolerans]|uniref:Penicillin acylase family protein n=1 Tax=Cryobacterium algoritolerans TaxID=1259184 RepID=A0A4R8WQR1_9MICO|nr:penicillin acylase family protein [Cryobacterium algoritolerans]TFC14550.1 penicillin acylase family protein [Cryobacterium algoritolerans]